jgi:hypothetical protein
MGRIILNIGQFFHLLLVTVSLFQLQLVFIDIT